MKLLSTIILIAFFVGGCGERDGIEKYNPNPVVPGMVINVYNKGGHVSGEGSFRNFDRYKIADSITVKYQDPINKEFTYIKTSDTTWKLLK